MLNKVLSKISIYFVGYVPEPSLYCPGATPVPGCTAQLRLLMRVFVIVDSDAHHANRSACLLLVQSLVL